MNRVLNEQSNVSGSADNRTRQSSVISRYPKGIVSFVIKHLRTNPYTPNPMAKPDASPKPHCADRPTHKPISRQITGLSICRPGLHRYVRSSINGRPTDATSSPQNEQS